MVIVSNMTSYKPIRELYFSYATLKVVYDIGSWWLWSCGKCDSNTNPRSRVLNTQTTKVKCYWRKKGKRIRKRDPVFPKKFEQIQLIHQQRK